MNEDIIKWAREAGIDAFGSLDERLIFFAALVAAAEREACAKVCDARCIADGWEGCYADECAAAIRARGQA
jgi:hypothetical protein